ncbi:SANT/Myb-like DNA-binding domain-containing protein [Aspergillus fijiensis CBS 313.89]|uniref:Myb-like transcription factor n=1 Tax=Aspergillus fijiensis CBS 313.89 TaxID=1448319 RepID=A0A8G1RXN1_9EURO|nr:uncharacterized protein BO72DRAFT_494311 [Aspergillus fijiensis CBS 313.89]RAK79451.1 hypothetical protein BO72DRAFT_494311 [Aspergillus fijiensis CBS 313.89]
MPLCRDSFTPASLNTGTWSPDEDERLREAVAQYGTRWVVVAAAVATRNGDQCAKRWNENLNPDLDHSPWTPQEDQLLLQLVDIYGRNWKFMANSFLGSRAPQALKNRYSLLMRRLKRRGSISKQPRPLSSSATTITTATNATDSISKQQTPFTPYFDLGIDPRATGMLPTPTEESSGSSGSTSYASSHHSSISEGSKPTTRPSSRSNSYMDLTNIFGTMTGTAFGDDVQYQTHDLFTTPPSTTVLVPGGGDGTTGTHHSSDANQLEWEVWQSLIDPGSGETTITTTTTTNSSSRSTTSSGSESEKSTPDAAPGLVSTPQPMDLTTGLVAPASTVLDNHGIEYSVRCSRANLKKLVHNLCDAAILETSAAMSEGDQVTLTLHLKT